jgi:pyrroline-5-carboxylate reductase
MIEIGFIGAGNMGEALIAGLVARGRSASSLGFADPNPERIAQMLARYPGIRSFEAQELVRAAEILVLAVKPQVMPQIIPALRDATDARDPLVISVAAGVSTDQIAHWLGPERRVIRAMPNTPALIGMGITGLFANENASPADCKTADQMLGTVGETLWLRNESEMHAVTGLSGSGPAYVFLLIEAMMAAGEQLGLEPQAARTLTLRTVAGAAMLAAGTDTAPAELRARVTSPGGTTEKALGVFAAQGFTEICSQAISAAAARSRELSAGSENTGSPQVDSRNP